MHLTAWQEAQIRQWILDGRSDEEIAQVMVISVKQVRPIRRATEEEARPG